MKMRKWRHNQQDAGDEMSLKENTKHKKKWKTKANAKAKAK